MDTTEKRFEEIIESSLVGDGGVDALGEERAVYAVGAAGAPRGFVRRDPRRHYDRGLCLDTEVLFDFLYATQPDAWERLKRQHGEKAKERFLARLVSEIERRGALDVLRRGVVDLGCRFELAYFRPETSLNAEHARLYNANTFAVMRQVGYHVKSGANEDRDALDLVLFLNGLPIFTAELKNALTGQSVQDAVRQYRRDRDPKEPLFRFGRCLAHFAVDTDLVYVTTHLRGEGTRFLPFNKGRDGGAGNPDNPNGYRSAYLWEEVWRPDSLLEMISRFIHAVDLEDENGRKTGKKALIFPRYHQLDAVRRLVANAKANGPGRNYLVQHSAGSGKSNSIAWLAHRLAGLHDARDRRIFDTIVVVTDRRVLDRQLQKTVTGFEQVRGTVVTVTERKAETLARALEGGAQIVVTTLQTFPFVAEKMGAMPGRNFAVIVDEAHSSQSGEGNRSLREVLSPGSLEEAEREEPPVETDEDRLNAEVERYARRRGRLPNASFFAFTATPKNKTLELFGERREDGSYAPFSLYSMRQAIEEGFILDVLENYTTYAVYFNLLKKVEDDPSYAKAKGISLLKSYAGLHEHAIRAKTGIMADHFHDRVRHRIGGLAKAMVVTRSRLHAVRYKLAFDRYLKEKGRPYRALVAFSGTVRDPATGLEYTEGQMNGLPETATAGTFEGPEYRFLIVANKFQTGFDQPLLHTMYVDKKLGGVNAVQTLSRLNRTHPGKEETFVLDFANRAEEIQKAFQPYYETTLLPEGTDPNKLYDLVRVLEDHRIYGRDDVEAFAAAYFAEGGSQEGLHPVLDPVVDEYLARDGEEQALFRKRLDDYVRLYAFLSQVLHFADAGLEKLYQFARFLLRKLPVGRERLPVEIRENINMDSYRVQQTSSGEIKLLTGEGELKPASELGPDARPEEEVAPLSEIIGYVNEHYGTDFTEEDKVAHFADDMQRRMTASDGLARAFDPGVNPSKEHRKLVFDRFFEDVLQDMVDSNFNLYKKIVDDPAFGALFKEAMFDRLEKELQDRRP